MSNDASLEKIKAAIKHMKSPLQDLPFGLVIEALTGYKVLKFDENNPTHKAT